MVCSPEIESSSLKEFFREVRNPDVKETREFAGSQIAGKIKKSLGPGDRIRHHRKFPRPDPQADSPAFVILAV
jgi:hypothetical protein